MAFSTTIKKKYWNMKMNDFDESGYFYEYKEDSDFWEKRMRTLRIELRKKGEVDGVFLVGNVVYRVKITEVESCWTRHIPEKYNNGLITTPSCHYLKCIPQISENCHPEYCDLLKSECYQFYTHHKTYPCEADIAMGRQKLLDEIKEVK